MTQVTVKGFVFPSPVAAVRFAEADDAKAIRINDTIMVVTSTEADRLESLSVPFTYLVPDGADAFRMVPACR
ncbi:MAG: hypothetical protein ACM359_11730 [Bacillota bacterium]